MNHFIMFGTISSEVRWHADIRKIRVFTGDTQRNAAQGPQQWRIQGEGAIRLCPSPIQSDSLTINFEFDIRPRDVVS